MLSRLAQGTRNLVGWQRALLAAGLGALAALALPPFHVIPVLLIAFTGLVWLTDAARAWRGAFFTGFWFGMGHFIAGLYWVGKSFAVAGVAEWAAPIAVFLLAVVCAVFPALATLALRFVPPTYGLRFVWFASAWTAGEWLRGITFLGGFPWNLIGYVWMPSDSMIQIGSLFGVYGLSWITVFAASSPAALSTSRRAWRGLAVSWVLLPIVAAAGAVRLSDATVASVPDVRLRLVQANIAQFHKWRDDLRAQNLQTYLAMSTAPPADENAPPPTHIIWPETAVPYVVANEPQIRGMISDVVPENGAILTGAVRAVSADEGGLDVWNSLHAIDETGAIVATYDKFHLVPFGEYTPFRDILKIAKLTEGDTDFSAGPGLQSLNILGLPPVSPLICYEVIFPGNVVAPDARPDWILNVTNDGWYGISSGPHQHFQQARMRAVEEGVPLVRVANTGISGIIDPYGRIEASLGLGETGVVDGALPAPLASRPLYTFWGDWPVFLVLLLSGFGLRIRLFMANSTQDS